MKKVMSLALALVMTLALALPVLAQEENFNTDNTALVPTIEVQMPSSAGVVLNPYGMTYKGGILGADTNTSTDQIISNVFSVTNKTQGAKLKLSVAFSGVTAGEAELEEDTSVTTFAATEKAKKVILTLKCGVTNTATATVPTAVPGSTTVRVKAAEQKFSDMILNAASGSDCTYVTFQFTGTAVTAPDTAWTDSDTVGASFVFTFEPAEASVTATSTVSIST